VQKIIVRIRTMSDRFRTFTFQIARELTFRGVNWFN